MPTYDYVCRACEHRFEHFQSMSEAVLRKCPECGRMRLERLIGAGAGILFKGSGFYETDYKRKAPEGGRSGGAKAGDGSKETPGSKPADGAGAGPAPAAPDSGGAGKPAQDA